MKPTSKAQIDAHGKSLGEHRDLVEQPPHRLHPWSRSKVISLSAALREVKDGCVLAVGGFTLHRRPIGAILGLIDLGVRGITLVDYIAAFEADILIGAGCVSTIRSCYCGMEIFGLAPMYRRAVSEGRVNSIAETEATITYGLRAARARTDFMPARICGGTQMLEMRPDLQLIASPYSDQKYVAVPALYPDVSIIHALMADDAGNTVLGSDLAVDSDLAAASKYTIITAEKIASTAEIERHGADILGAWVDAVVEQPRGAWPSSCLPEYAHDMTLFADYMDACKDGRFDTFITEIKRGSLT